MEEINFNDLIERLRRIENFTTAYDYIDSTCKILKMHIAYLALYHDDNNNFSHWCKEICEMLENMKTKRKFEHKSKKMTWIEIYNYITEMFIPAEKVKYDAIHKEKLKPFYEVSNDELEDFIEYMLRNLLVERKNKKLEPKNRVIFPEEIFNLAIQYLNLDIEFDD